MKTDRVSWRTWLIFARIYRRRLRRRDEHPDWLALNFWFLREVRIRMLLGRQARRMGEARRAGRITTWAQLEPHLDILAALRREQESCWISIAELCDELLEARIRREARDGNSHLATFLAERNGTLVAEPDELLSGPLFDLAWPPAREAAE